MLLSCIVTSRASKSVCFASYLTQKTSTHLHWWVVFAEAWHFQSAGSAQPFIATGKAAFFRFAGYLFFVFRGLGVSCFYSRTIYIFEMCTFNLVALRWAASSSSSSTGGESTSLSEVSGISAACAFLYCTSKCTYHTLLFYCINVRFTLMYNFSSEWLKPPRRHGNHSKDQDIVDGMFPSQSVLKGVILYKHVLISF